MMNNARPPKALKWIVGVGVVLTLLGTYTTVDMLRAGPSPAGEIKTVTEFRDGNPLPAFQLNRYSGKSGPFTEADLQGRWSFLFFGYTQCPDVCPTALSTMKALKAELTAAETKTAVSPAPTFQVVFVSVDPARDTPALLDEFMRAFDPEFIGVSGTDTALAPLTKGLGVYFQRHDATDKKHYTVDHTATIYLIDPQGRLAAIFSPPQQAAAMSKDFRRIAQAYSQSFVVRK